MRRGRNRRRQSSRSQSRGGHYSRATAVVLNSKNEVLLVRHRRQNEWALPGGQVRAGEDPASRVVIEVAEETGIRITQPRFIGRHAGSVASHEIYLAHSDGVPRPDNSEIQEALWWDGTPSIRVQRHVDAILAITLNKAEERRSNQPPSDVSDSSSIMMSSQPPESHGVQELGSASSWPLSRLWSIIGLGFLLVIAFLIAYMLF